MSDKKNFSAVISLAAEMGGSVKSVFGNAKKETDKLGAAINGLYDKQKKIGGAMGKERAFKDAEAALIRAQRAQARADKLAKEQPWNKDAQKIAAAKARETAKAIALMDKEAKSMTKLDAAMKAAGVDSNKLAHEQAKLSGEIEKMERKMQARERWGKVGSRAWKTGAAVAGVGIGIVGGLFGIAKHEATESREMLAMSRGLGMSPEYLQTYRKLGKGVAVESGMVDSILTKTVKSIEKAQTGKGKEFAALRELRINVAGLRKLKPEKQIEVIGNALNAYKGKANKSALMAALTGRGGPDVARFVGALAKGAGAIEALKKDGVSTGLFKTQDELEKSEKLDKVLVRLGDNFTALKNTVGEAVTPAFTEFFGVVNDTIRENMPAIREWVAHVGHALEKWIESGDARREVEKMGRAVKWLVDNAGAVVDKFGAAKSAAVALGVITFAPLIASLVTAVAQTGLLLVNLRAAKALQNVPGVPTGGAPVPVPAGGGAMKWLWGAAAWLGNKSPYVLPFMISGDSKRPEPGGARNPAYGTIEYRDYAEGQYAAARSKNQELQMAKRRRSRWNVDLTGNRKWTEDNAEKAENSWREILATIARKSAPHFPGLGLPTGSPVVNNPTFNFTVNAAPGQSESSIGEQIADHVKELLGLKQPALRGAMLHD